MRRPRAKSLQSCPTLCDPIDGSHQAPPFLGFSTQGRRRSDEALFLGSQVPCDLVRTLEIGRLYQTRSTRPSGLSGHLARDEGHGEASLHHRSG